jgi:Xaa-Pro aminopeptidase
MIVSNEPGYYKTGEYGIRIENLQVVTPPTDIPGGERPMLGFEPLTLAPIDRKLIDVDLLDAVERAQMDAYHARVLAEIGPQLEGDAAAWLRDACAPV